MSVLAIVLVSIGAVLYLCMAGVVAWFIYESDRDYWTDSEGRISDFDLNTAAMFGGMCGIMWPLTLLAAWAASASENKR